MQKFTIEKRRKASFCIIPILYAFCVLYCSADVTKTNIDFELLQHKLTIADEIRSSHREQFNQLVKELVQSRSKLTNRQDAYLNYLLGYQQLLAGNLDIGIDLLNQVIAHDEYEVLKYRAIITKINVHTTSKNYAEGFIVLNNLLPKLKTLENTQAYHEALMVVSLFYSRLGQYELSKQYATQLLDSAPSQRFECLATMLDIEASYYLNQLNERSIKPHWTLTCDRANELIASNTIRLVAAKIYLDVGRPQQALDLLLTYLDEAKGTGYYLLESQFHTYLALAYYALNQINVAEQFALRVLDSVGALHSSDAFVYASELLFKINKKRKNYRQALEFHELHLRFSQEYRDDLKSRDVTFKIAEENNRQKTLEIEVLAQRNKVLALENAIAATQQTRDRIIQGLFLAIIAILIYWAYRSRKTQNKLKTMAAYDPLTNIFNRRFFTELAESALKYYGKAEQPVCLVLFDLDKFKGINDDFGHQIGDWVLKEAVEACKKFARKNDVFGRFGGEEFTVLLPGCNTSKALEIAEKYRVAITKIDSTMTGHTFTVTASFGISCTDQVGYKLSSLVSAADKAMYHSKDSGRDRLTTYDSLISCT